MYIYTYRCMNNILDVYIYVHMYSCCQFARGARHLTRSYGTIQATLLVMPSLRVVVFYIFAQFVTLLLSQSQGNWPRSVRGRWCLMAPQLKLKFRMAFTLGISTAAFWGLTLLLTQHHSPPRLQYFHIYIFLFYTSGGLFAYMEAAICVFLLFSLLCLCCGTCLCL